MEIKDICSLSVAVISLIVSIFVVVINTKRFKEQLIHGVNKDWFLMFSQLVGDVSTLRGIWKECHEQIGKGISVDANTAKMGEAKSKLYSDMYTMEILLNGNHEEDLKLIKDILKYFDEKGSWLEVDKLDYILKNIIKPASRIVKRAKGELYAKDNKKIGKERF